MLAGRESAVCPLCGEVVYWDNAIVQAAVVQAGAAAIKTAAGRLLLRVGLRVVHSCAEPVPEDGAE